MCGRRGVKCWRRPHKSVQCIHEPHLRHAPRPLRDRLLTWGRRHGCRVSRARDRKLNRDVAIKVRLRAVANDAERLARFQREAQVLASLNHPNIAHIHGLEEANGTTALVLELVEGPTLAGRTAHGPIPRREGTGVSGCDRPPHRGAGLSRRRRQRYGRARPPGSSPGSTPSPVRGAPTISWHAPRFVRDPLYSWRGRHGLRRALGIERARRVPEAAENQLTLSDLG